MPKVSRIEIMSCEVSRLCEIEFLDAINNERQALVRRKNQTNVQSRGHSGSSGVRSGSNGSISSLGRFSWLYDELMDRMGDKETVNKIVEDLNQKWICEEKHRQQSMNLVIKEMKKQTYSGKVRPNLLRIGSQTEFWFRRFDRCDPLARVLRTRTTRFS